MDTHPSKFRINEEFHKRPPISLETDLIVHHLVLTFTTDYKEEIRHNLKPLLQAFNLEPSSHYDGQQEILIRAPGIIIKWEHHAEFQSFTFYTKSQTTNLHELLPPQWQHNLVGECIVALNIHIQASSKSIEYLSKKPNFEFSRKPIAGSLICDSHASIWSDFRIDQQGHTNIIVKDAGLGPFRSGRLVQRLIDIETYRALSMLSLADTDRVNISIRSIDRELNQLSKERLAHENKPPSEAMLNQLLTLASRSEAILTSTSQRFSATQAYLNIVLRRMEELVNGGVKTYQKAV